MQITTWYTRNFEDRLKGRYVAIKHILPILKDYQELFNVSVAGYSEVGVAIPLVSFGQGEKIVLIWSQMHGNESTTTKALFDFFKFTCSNLLPAVVRRPLPPAQTAPPVRPHRPAW